MSFNDDEPVQLQNSGSKLQTLVDGKVKVSFMRNKQAPLQENTQKVLLELTGGVESVDRPGLDLVAVLDVSGSMQDGDKIGKMKSAMQFVIRKLGPNDRLSIVTFSSTSSRLCPLRQMTEAAQPVLMGHINHLRADGGTNISEGLRTGLKVLADRKDNVDRCVAVMLMSDGKQTNGDAAGVVIGKVPVFTFGFGADYDGKVLNAVAKNSGGGTFSTVNDISGLSTAFSQCLGLLLTLLLDDLKLTVAPGPKGVSKIQKVTSGSYVQVPVADSISIDFGTLYSKEVRKVVVDVLLPPVEKMSNVALLLVSYSYTFKGQPAKRDNLKVTILRTGKASLGDMKPVAEVQTEEARLSTAGVIKEARTLADQGGKHLDDARVKLAEARNALEQLEEKASPLVNMLRLELSQLLKLMQSQDLYERQGRSYALSAETSHDRQRFAARGDVGSMRLFSTPRMDKYLEQAKKFDKDPTAPLPSVDEDIKEEIAANPLGPVAGPITFYIQAAIEALQAIGNIINNEGQP